MGAETAPRCDMVDTCAAPVTMIDQSGFVYCTAHGTARRAHRPCRKLRPHELARLARGELIKGY